MRGRGLLIVGLCLFASMTQTADAGLMISMRGIPGSTEVSINLSGEATFGQSVSNATNILFTRSPGSSNPIETFSPIATFGNMTLSSEPFPVAIREIQLTKTSLRLVTGEFSAQVGTTLKLPGTTTNVNVPFGNDVSYLGLGNFSLINSPLEGSHSLVIAEDVGGRPPVVPEPASLAIFGFGAIAMLGGRLRKKKS